MPNEEHVALLKKGVDAWNAWRDGNRNIDPDLSRADLSKAELVDAHLGGANLGGANFSEADLTRANLARVYLCEANLVWANLGGAYLGGANLSGADLRHANLGDANFSHANLSGAKLGGALLHAADIRWASLSGADLSEANLGAARLLRANLSGANLRGAYVGEANLSLANLRGANLGGADLSEANLSRADLGEADLSGANLNAATLVSTDLTGANLTGCRIYGISAWSLELDTTTKQQNLVITPEKAPAVTVDNIEVAQFIYLMLKNEKVRDAIDTITSKAVLILGRFTDERKAVLDALREELRMRNYLPILFDFDKPRSRDTDETITLLARMARFIIADVTDAKAVLQELRGIVPDLPSVPVQSIILATQEEPGMFDHYRNMSSFLKPVHRYADQEQLLADLSDKVILPAEQKVQELRDNFEIKVDGVVRSHCHVREDAVEAARSFQQRKPGAAIVVTDLGDGSTVPWQAP
jgi:uncharacterized protein YjbI with pentapeptide repeats